MIFLYAGIIRYALSFLHVITSREQRERRGNPEKAFLVRSGPEMNSGRLLGKSKMSFRTCGFCVE